VVFFQLWVYLTDFQAELSISHSVSDANWANGSRLPDENIITEKDGKDGRITETYVPLIAINERIIIKKEEKNKRTEVFLRIIKVFFSILDNYSYLCTALEGVAEIVSIVGLKLVG